MKTAIYDNLKEEQKERIMQAMGHEKWCNMNPNTMLGCTCDKEQK